MCRVAFSPCVWAAFVAKILTCRSLCKVRYLMRDNQNDLLRGLPKDVAVMFKRAVRDITQYPGITCKIAAAHRQAGNFSTAEKLLSGAIRSPQPEVRLQAADEMLRLLNHNPVSLGNFYAAVQEVGKACERGNPQAWNLAQNLSTAHFDVRYIMPQMH